jgi:hypothetical protein
MPSFRAAGLAEWSSILLGVSDPTTRLNASSAKPNIVPKPSDSARVSTERHYSPAEIAELWGLSQDSVRRLFKEEPGVLLMAPRKRRGKRAYVTLRIPESVVERVHRNLSVVR